MNRPLTLITGASSGIGKSFAERLAHEGHDLILVARRQAALEELSERLASTHGVAVHVMPQDLTAQDAPERLFEKISQAGLKVTGLINNAGFGIHGAVAQNSPQALEEMLMVNVMALTKLSRLFLPPMIEQGAGFILNVASTAAFQPVAYMAAYAATKSYVLSFSEGLASEVAGHGVKVIALCPGFTRTEFLEVADVKSRLMRFVPMMSVEAVVSVGLTAIRRNQVVSIPGTMNALAARISSMVPRPLRNFVVSRLFQVDPQQAQQPRS